MRTSFRSDVKWIVTASLMTSAWTAAVRAEGYIYYGRIYSRHADDGAIWRIHTSGGPEEKILSTGSGVRGIAVDGESRTMYWADVDRDVIWRCRLDGSELEPLVSDGLSFPFGLALDPVGRRLYWADQGLDRIQSCDLSGGDIQNFVEGAPVSALAVDAARRELYWTVWGNDDGTIVKASLEGGPAQTVVRNEGKPAYLALDAAADRIYWTDYVQDVVRRSHLDGSAVEILFSSDHNRNPDGIAVDPLSNRVYWGQDQECCYAGAVMQMRLNGESPIVMTSSDGLIPGVVFQPEAGCSGGERVHSVLCRESEKFGTVFDVDLRNGTPGEPVSVVLDGGRRRGSVCDGQGNALIHFRRRIPALVGTAYARWECGAVDSEPYDCR